MEKLEMTIEPMTSGAVLKRLHHANAFRKIRKYVLDRALAEQTISEVCTEYLHRFQHDQELRQTRDDLLARSRGARANARMVNWGDGERERLLRQAEALKHAAEMAGESAGLRTESRSLKRGPGGLCLQVTRNRPSTVRAARDAKHLDMLTVDLCVVLRHGTRMSIVDVVGAVPPIFEALRAAYADFLPKRGLSDPESRFKRFMKRARKAFRSRGQTIKTRALLESRKSILMSQGILFSDPATGSTIRRVPTTS